MTSSNLILDLFYYYYLSIIEKGFSKIYTYWVHYKKMHSITELMREFHNLNQSPKVTGIMFKYAKYCLTGCKICFAIYIFSGITLYNNFILVKLVTGELVLPFGVYLPWINPFSFWGYLINLGYQFILGFLTVMGFIYADSLYITIVLHVYCIYDVLIQLLDELNQSILNEDNSIKIDKQLVFIIQLHQRLLRFDLISCWKESFNQI